MLWNLQYKKNICIHVYNFSNNETYVNILARVTYEDILCFHLHQMHLIHLFSNFFTLSVPDEEDSQKHPAH
jgi:hypothetical protein